MIRTAHGCNATSGEIYSLDPETCHSSDPLLTVVRELACPATNGGELNH